MKNKMTKEDNEKLINLLKLAPNQNYYKDYLMFYEKITGRKENSTCSSCAMRRILQLLIRYKNSII